jgi:multiple sugar transport system ATP-binding protein
MVFQSYALYPHMSVFDNMSFALKLRKVPRRELERKVHDAAELLEIAHLLRRKPKEISGGERQRVALARAIVREPQVFLMDEPLSNLDAKLRLQTRAELVKLHRRLEATVIYVTHDQVEAMTMADRIALLRGGVLQQVDRPQAIYDRPANMFVGGFTGSPGMNFFAGRLLSDGQGVMVDAGIFRLPLALPSGDPRPYLGRAVVVGVRPEDILLRPSAGQGEGARLGEGMACPPDAAFQAQVDMVEPLGSEQLLHLVAQGSAFVARVDPRQPAQVGEVLPLTLNAERVRLFDPQTEEALW